VEGPGNAADLLATAFAGLPVNEARRLAELGAIERIPAQHVLFEEGDAADRVYVRLEGQLRVSSSHVEFRTLRPGEAFGELALLDGGRRSADVEAVLDSTVFAIDRDTFLGSVHRSPRLASAVLGDLTGYVRANNERLLREQLEQRALSVPTSAHCSNGLASADATLAGPHGRSRRCCSRLTFCAVRVLI
jgi:CRP-like cAMP-binding protein